MLAAAEGTTDLRADRHRSVRSHQKPAVGGCARLLLYALSRGPGAPVQIRYAEQCTTCEEGLMATYVTLFRYTPSGIMFLASAAARFVTGTALVVDGGYAIR